MKRLGKYELIAELARGGMGTVFLAIARSPGAPPKSVVVKMLRRDESSSSEALPMFREEARLSARLNHPGIVHVYDVGVSDDDHFLVMEYLEGVSLSRALKPGVDLALAVRLHILCSVLDALHYAHTLVTPDGKPAEIVHRDATPSNVFLTFDGDVKLVDFGVAKSLRDSGLETRTGTFKGKPSYMAPEQIRGKVTPQIDVFAVGAMLWESIAGRRMWARRTEVELLSALVCGEIPRIEEVVPDVPDELRRIVERALAPEPADRYASADEFLSDLAPYAAKLKSSSASKRLLTDRLNTVFAAERDARRAAVAQAIEAHEQAPDDVASLPVLPPVGEPPSGESERSDSNSRRTPPAEVRPSLTAPSGATRLSAVAPPRSNARRAAGPLLLVALAVPALAALVISRQNRAAEPQATASAAPPAAAAATTEAARAPAGPSTHRLTVSVTPASAKVTVNGTAHPNPFFDECRGGATLVIRATASGYETLEREATCDRDEALDLALARFSAPAPGPGPRPSKAEAPAPAVSAAAGRKASDLSKLDGEKLEPAKPPKPAGSLDSLDPSDFKGRSR